LRYAKSDHRIQQPEARCFAVLRDVPQLSSCSDNTRLHADIHFGIVCERLVEALRIRYAISALLMLEIPMIPRCKATQVLRKPKIVAVPTPSACIGVRQALALEVSEGDTEATAKASDFQGLVPS